MVSSIIKIITAKGNIKLIKDNTKIDVKNSIGNNCLNVVTDLCFLLTKTFQYPYCLYWVYNFLKLALTLYWTEIFAFNKIL